MATIADKKVVKINYTLKDKEGQVIDQSQPGNPLAYLHGASNIIPGLETKLTGKGVGDHVDVVVQPDEGYGQRDDSLIQQVPKTQFPAEDIQVGTQFVAEGPEGSFPVTVVGVDDANVTVDGNHPLAGVELHFSVDVVEIRDATSEEIDHGHVHDGTHHH